MVLLSSQPVGRRGVGPFPVCVPLQQLQVRPLHSLFLSCRTNNLPPLPCVCASVLCAVCVPGPAPICAPRPLSCCIEHPRRRRNRPRLLASLHCAAGASFCRRPAPQRRRQRRYCRWSAPPRPLPLPPSSCHVSPLPRPPPQYRPHPGPPHAPRPRVAHRVRYTPGVTSESRPSHESVPSRVRVTCQSRPPDSPAAPPAVRYSATALTGRDLRAAMRSLRQCARARTDGSDPRAAAELAGGRTRPG